MKTLVKFYAITFVDKNNRPINHHSVFDFLVNLDKLLEENVSYVIKNIEDKYIRCFKPKTVGSDMKRIVFPIGKKKDSASYTEDASSKSIIEIDYNIFDINLMYYDEHKHAFIMTCSKGAPTYKIIESYFNCFLREADYQIAIMPMKYNKDLNFLRNAKRIKSIIITVDLGNDINSGFINDYENNGLLKSFFKISENTKESLQCNILKLEIALDGRKRKATMAVDNALNLISCLNLESDFIKEIEIQYANNEMEKLSEARLKNTNINLEYEFSTKKRMGIEELREKGDEAFLQTANTWYSIIKQYIPNSFQQSSVPVTLVREEYKNEPFEEIVAAPV